VSEVVDPEYGTTVLPGLDKVLKSLTICIKS
jgi:hypothetical protein